MNPEATTPEKLPSTNALRRLSAVLVPVAIATAMFDLCFWAGHWGISVGLFFGALGLLILSRHERKVPTASTIGITLLLAGAIVQSAIQTSLSNAIACAALVLALAGSVFHAKLATMWARISEVCFGFITAPFRWLRVGATATESLQEVRLPGINIAALLTKAAWVLGPAVVLLLVFTAVFAAGNPLFAEFVQSLGRRAGSVWELIDLTPARVFMWGVVATIALGLFHGTAAPDSPRWWTRTLPRIPRPDFNLAALQSAAILAALNGLFFVVNTLDGLYLWRHHTLPVGINRSELVHEGVNATMLAVILSAVIIAGIFQQDDRAASRRWLKWISHIWVLQNLSLIASSFLRLKFYTQDYMLTEKRVYVGFFLALVAAGFLLLLWFVAKRRSFNWLLGTNAVATFLLFYVVQFPDVARFVADYNIAQAEREKRHLDVSYIATLGPGAWPSLVKFASNPQNPARDEIRGHLELVAEAGESTDWRATQLRRNEALAVVRKFLDETKPAQ
ncbi:MAG: hypothetical protein RL088_2323 [Verrucomicrobiota bacterium]